MEQQQPSGEDGAGQREDDVSSSALPPPPPPPRTVSLDAEDLDPAEVLLLADKQQSNLLVQIPVPEARVFNNLAEYYSRTFAKKKQEEHKPPPSAVMDQQQISATKRPLQPPPQGPGPSKPRRGPKRDSRSVLDKMAEQQQGPLSLLYRAMTSDSLRVRILVRRRKAKPLRTERFSWINGHLAAFDKHLNLALREAVEEYDHQLLEDNNEVVVVGVRKHTPQLFVRGDTVVLVSLVEDGGPLKESSDK